MAIYVNMEAGATNVKKYQKAFHDDAESDFSSLFSRFQYVCVCVCRQPFLQFH